MEVILLILLMGWLFGGNKDDDDYNKRCDEDFWGRCWDEDHR